MFRILMNRVRRNVWNVTPFVILVLGMISVLLVPTAPKAAASDVEQWSVDSKLLTATYYYVLDTAHLGGANNTVWRSNLEVCNFGMGFNSFELQFLVFNQANLNPAVAAYGLGANLCRRYNDVLANVFNEQSSKGTVRIETQDSGLRAVARTFNFSPSGTYGQFSEGRFASEGVGPGDAGSIIHLSQATGNNTGFRTNVSLQNTTAGNIRVHMDCFLNDGTNLGRVTRDLLAYEYDQIGTIFREVTQSEVVDGYIILTTPTAGGQFLAAGSMVDNQTGDGTTIPMERIP